MKTPPKPVLIAGAAVVALGGIYLIRKKEQASKEEFIPTTGPTTYVGSQEAAGNFGNFGGGGTGGGVPSIPATGVTTVPPPQTGCPEGTYFVGISSIAGKPGGVRCVKNNFTPPKEATKATPHPKTFHPV
jgi:hypothetical protein